MHFLNSDNNPTDRQTEKGLPELAPTLSGGAMVCAFFVRVRLAPTLSDAFTFDAFA